MNGREYASLINRQRRLPMQLAAARLRVRHLELEAQRLGLHDILENPAVADQAWEREIELARIDDITPAVIDRSAA